MLYLSVAKMSSPPSLSNIWVEADEEHQTTSQIAVPPLILPSSSIPQPQLQSSHDNRRHSSSVNLNIVNTLRGITAPEPVFVKASFLGTLNPIPAVRITYTQPKHEVNIVPLSRAELGEVWSTPDEISQLEITTIPRGWHSAFAAFISHIEYPQDYLSHMLSVLRTLQFMNDIPLDLTKWKFACRCTNDMLYIVITCPSCRLLRFMSMRTLYTSSKKTKPCI